MERADRLFPTDRFRRLAAIDFTKQLFGAKEGHRMMAPDGKRLMHGEIVLDGHKFFPQRPVWRRRGRHPQISASTGGTCVRITSSRRR